MGSELRHLLRVSKRVRRAGGGTYMRTVYLLDPNGHVEWRDGDAVLARMRQAITQDGCSRAEIVSVSPTGEGRTVFGTVVMTPPKRGRRPHLATPAPDATEARGDADGVFRCDRCFAVLPPTPPPE